jgi:hypothetical protein
MSPVEASLVSLEAGGTHILVVEEAKDDPAVAVTDSMGGTWMNIGKPDAIKHGSVWVCDLRVKNGAKITTTFASGKSSVLVVLGIMAFSGTEGI